MMEHEVMVSYRLFLWRRMKLYGSKMTITEWTGDDGSFRRSISYWDNYEILLKYGVFDGD